MKNSNVALCTLFGSNYADKGLVMFESLCKVSSDFVLYVLCMDDLCNLILKSYDDNRLIPITLSEFENEKIRELKSQRSFSEYCWTCSSLLIKYILDNKPYEVCAYIDADLFFYSDPIPEIEAVKKGGYSAMFVPHNFSKAFAGKEKEVGVFCVEFNPFVNSTEGLKVLDEWISLCMGSCSLDRDGVTFGDQKYLDILKDKYESIFICQNPGVGIAPWNIEDYSLKENGLYYVNDLCKPVFYHFQCVEFVENFVKTNVNKKNVNSTLFSYFYVPYIKKLRNKRAELKNEYNMEFPVNYSKRFNNKKKSLKSQILFLLLKIPYLKKIYYSQLQYYVLGKL